MAIKLKDLVAGQQRLNQKEEAPVRLNPDQFKGLVEALSGAATSAGAKSGAQIFEDFVNQTRKREELLKDATEEQKAIFAELEQTLNKLQTANHADSVGLRRSIEALNRRLASTPNTNAKTRMVTMIPPAPASASTKNTSAPTLSPENYAVNESATTAGTAETKTANTGGGLGAAIQGIGTAIGGIAQGIGAAIEGLGRVLGGAIMALAGAMGIKNFPGIPDIPTGPGGPSIPGGPENPTKKGPSAKPNKYKNLLKIGKIASVAGIASLLADPARDYAEKKGFTETAAGIDTAGTTLGYASAGSAAGGLIGAALGLPFGGVGAIPGAVLGGKIGGIAGGAYGLYQGVKKNYVDAMESKAAFSGEAAFERKKGGYDPLAELQAENNTLKLDDRGRPITVVSPQIQNPMGNQDKTPVFASSPNVRPNENTFTRYMDRIFGH
jgi:hypothetical protein